MEYLTKDGVRRRVHKMYVDVVVRMSDEGRIDPLSVVWPDGRVYRIDEIVSRGQPGQTLKGARTARYRVRFGRHETDLYLEHRRGDPAMGTPDRLRWWVYAVDATLQGTAG